MAIPQASTSHSLDSPASAGLQEAPLFHAAWLFALGIVAAHWLWLRPSLALIALVAAGLLCAIAALKAPRVSWLALGALWLLLGAWCAEMEPQPVAPPTLARLSDGLLRTVEGTVVDTGPLRTEREDTIREDTAEELTVAAPSQSPSQNIDLRVATIEKVTDAADRQIPATGGVRLTVRWPEPEQDPTASQAAPQPFPCGERVRAIARLLPPETYHDPGVWSRADYLLGQGITSSAGVSIERVTRLGLARGAYFTCRMHTWQHATTARLLALPAAMHWLPAPLRLSENDAIMLAAMIAGDRSYLTHSLRAGFERTGSFHMLVVSGLHLAIVAGCVLWIARKLRLGRISATFVTIAFSFGYALFTGFATPVERSLLMITIYLLGRLVYRERSPLNVIGFAALVLLAASPRALFDASFQMTLLAVVAIAGIAAPLVRVTAHPYLSAARDLRRVEIDIKLAPRLAAFRVAMRMIAERLERAINRFVAWRMFPWAVRVAIGAVELVAVSCIIELAMTLPMAVYFHRITLFALPVNLLIVPLLLVLVPAALVTVLVLLAWPAAAVIPAVAVALVLHIGVGLVQLFGDMRMGDFRIPGPLLWQTAAFCALLGAAIALAHFGAGRADSSRAWARRTAWAVLIAAACIAVAPRPVVRPRNALLMEAIDVGQGDSLLLITPDGKTLLVDAGGFGGGVRHPPRNFDIGEDVVSPTLWSRGIRHLDAVALTHTDSDHMGGMPAVLRNFHPNALWVGDNAPIPRYRALLAEAAALHIPVRSYRAGDAFPFGAAQVRVLSPFRGAPVSRTHANDNMLVLRVAYGATSVLLEGDAEAPLEHAMLAEPDLESTLLKVGHHGSLTSTTPPFLARVDPRWAVISCGLHNDYGHPREEVLEALEAAHARTFRTDIEGASCFVLNGTRTRPDYACGWRDLR